jgi:thiol-disulfide isomerase/thioredoxin
MQESQRDSPKRSSRRLLLGTAVVAALAGSVVNWSRLRPRTLDPEATQALWSAEFDQADGQVLRLSDFQGKPLVLNFWATWCIPCVEEMPLLNAFFQENQSKSWQVVGLAIDQPSAVKRFLKQYPVGYPIGMAGLGGTELLKKLGNPQGSLPFTLVLNATGDLVAQKLGKLSSQEMADWL